MSTSRRAVALALVFVLGSRLLAEEPKTALDKPAAVPKAEASPKSDTPAKATPPAKKSPAKKAAPADSDWVEQLVTKCQPSVVVITVQGREGKQDGLGSGFVVRPDGLIATNLHVIGEARPIHVRFTNGKQFPVVAVEATDRTLDLALIRIDARDLPTLPLGDSDKVRQGQRVVALGNPLGLEHSVVAGVVSGSREINHLPLLQLAIPIEPGNSGGPLVDDQGRVQGLLTMKSLVTQNLGFAVKVNALKGLLERPNPVPMTRWLTIGALDPRQWEPILGATWRQRSGRIVVEGTGSGFGGRSLCLSKQVVPDEAYEATVTVKLDDDAGAAGLIFASDASNRHYGFYPSNSRVRLTRFDGSDVLSWNVLSEQPTPHYRAGDWNTLKVRVEGDKLICWLNGEPVIESHDTQLRGGRVGLAKFRNTKAEFKQFRVAKQLAGDDVATAVVDQLDRSITALVPEKVVEPAVIDDLAKHAELSSSLLQARAKALEAQAQRLRELSETVHRRQVEQQLAEEMRRSEDQCDLIFAALLVARLDNPELDVTAYRQEVQRMANEIRESLAKDADESVRLLALNKYLFADNGFHGSRSDYDNRANSYLNAVIDDREGLPLTLSILYMELGRQLGLKIVGIGTPGHFVVRHDPKEGAAKFVDPFENGELLDRDALAEKIESLSGRKIEDDDVKGVSKRQIIERMLRNLLGNANREERRDDMLSYLDAILVVNPSAVEERVMRAVMHYQGGKPQAGLKDTAWLLDNQPAGVDLERVRELHQALERAELRKNR